MDREANKDTGGRGTVKLTKPAIREIESALEKGMVCEISCIGQLLRVNVHPQSADILFPFPYMVKAEEAIVISIQQGSRRIEAVQTSHLARDFFITGIKGYKVGEP